MLKVSLAALSLLACASTNPAPSPAPAAALPAASNDAASNDAASNDAASNDAASNDAASNDAASNDAPRPADGGANPADAAAGAPIAARAEGPAQGVRMYRGRSEDEWIRRMREQPVVRAVERFHSTLYVWHLDLGDGIEVSFQPEQTRLETFWRREVASWHLARLLGINHRAPPTVSRRIPVAALGRSGRNTDLVVDARGMVVGSASAWVPTLEHVHMHLRPARRIWSGYVNPSVPLPTDPAERERARQVAEVLVFDYLAANYDRWNCCNIAADERGDLVFRDNDAGWVPNIINNLGSPGVVRRLPRSLYEGIERATPAALRASIAQDPEGARGRLIPEGAYTGYEARRQALLASIRRAIARHGEAAVFPWP
jgi:hypothetical protein